MASHLVCGRRLISRHVGAARVREPLPQLAEVGFDGVCVDVRRVHSRIAPAYQSQRSTQGHGPADAHQLRLVAGQSCDGRPSSSDPIAHHAAGMPLKYGSSQNSIVGDSDIWKLCTCMIEAFVCCAMLF